MKGYPLYFFGWLPIPAMQRHLLWNAHRFSSSEEGARLSSATGLPSQRPLNRFELRRVIPRRRKAP